jgi:hypothetical protein
MPVVALGDVAEDEALVQGGPINASSMLAIRHAREVTEAIIFSPVRLRGKCYWCRIT